MSALDGAVGFLFEHPVALVAGCAAWVLLASGAALLIGRAIETVEYEETDDGLRRLEVVR